MTRPAQTFGDTLRQLRTEAGLAQGELVKQAIWSQSQISRTEQNLFSPDKATVERLDRALNANGQLITAHTSTTAPSSELLHLGRDPLVFSDLMRKIHRTDVGRDTIDQLTVITEQLCCVRFSPPTSYATMHTTNSNTSNACSKDPLG